MHINANATEIIFPWNWTYRQTVESLGAGNQTQVLRKTVWSQPPSHLPSSHFLMCRTEMFLKDSAEEQQHAL